ncbi:hypothetical protein DY000_02015783 [Brassica cretica]|uniref:Secreted protein n=1 Tax=Brassica cretica TaxID=69181 RepID=A0ABQ7CVF1_BRACR|nr:hypothetical protein DY000_02015783 [Brassica cretica]
MLASLNRVYSSALLSILKDFSSPVIALSNSRLVCVLLGGKGGKVLYTLSIAGSVGLGSRSTLFSVCRSISASSSIFPSSSSSSMASSSVLGFCLSRGIPDTIALSSSRLVCVLSGGKGGRVLYTLSIAGSVGVGSLSTLFSECRSILTVAGRSILVLPCRSISASSSISPYSSSSSMASSSVLGFCLSRGIPESVLGSLRSIGRDIFSPVSSTTTCFSVLLISIALGMRRFPLLNNTALT